MKTYRTSIAAAKRDAIQRVDALIRLEERAQRLRFPGVGRPGATKIPQKHYEIILEGVMLDCFRAFEVYLEEVFILYAIGKKNISGKKYSSVISGASYSDCRAIIKQGARFIDWTEPDSILARADIFFNRETVIHDVMRIHKAAFRDIKRVRNHIAHRSEESYIQYRKTVNSELMITMISPMEPGDYLSRLRIRGAREPLINFYTQQLRTWIAELSG